MVMCYSSVEVARNRCRCRCSYLQVLLFYTCPDGESTDGREHVAEEDIEVCRLDLDTSNVRTMVSAGRMHSLPQGVMNGVSESCASSSSNVASGNL